MLALFPFLSISLQVWLMIYVILIDELSSNIFQSLFAMQLLSSICDCYNLVYISKNITTQFVKIVKATFFISLMFITIIIILLCKSKHEIETINKEETTKIAWYVSISFFITSKAFLCFKNVRYYQLKNNFYLDVV